LLATALVAGLPVWAVLGFGERLGLWATVLSIALSFVLAHIGSIAWSRWPASRDVVFNDLMLWGFVRRLFTQRRLIRRVERLGFTSSNDPDEMTLEERTKLLKRLAAGLEAGDPYTHGHSQRVARHAYMVAKTMKLSRRDAEKIRLAGVIHDIGKLRIPREIITKPGALTDEEFDLIKRHTVDGAAMVEVLGDAAVTHMVRHHHERLDGSGYPDKLAGDQISIGARVLAVADTFDAASSLRPYRDPQKHKVALDILEKEARAGRLDPEVVDAFVRYYSGRKALRWWTFLSAGPAHLYDVPLAFLQRVSAAGIANAAVVGVTAVALAPGSPLHGGGPVTRDIPRNDRADVQASRGRDVGSTIARAQSGAGHSAGTGSVKENQATMRTPSRTRAGQSTARTGRPKDHERGPSNGQSEKGSDKETGNDSSTQEKDALEGEVAEAVDTTTGGAPGTKDDSDDDGSDLIDTETEETTTVPGGSAPGNSGGHGKDED